MSRAVPHTITFATDIDQFSAMSPEELNELRKSAAMVTQIGIHNAEICKHPYNGVNNASFALVNLPGLLAHIDQQAAQIENRNLVIGMHQEAISTQTSLINVLKEKLVEEMAWWIFATSQDGLNDDFLRRFRRDSEGDFDPIWLDEAHQHLKADPDLNKVGVEWE